MAGIDQRWVAELNARSDIVSVVSSYVRLTSKGRNFWGLCPFHGEKTPSFSVNPDKGIFYCFGCHVGGDAIRFVMEIERLPFIDAVKILADKANMELPEYTRGKNQASRQELDRLYLANKLAARFFNTSLVSKEGESARAYLNGRGLSNITITRFGLGYSPDSWGALTDHLHSQGYEDDELVKLNLANAKNDRVYDNFRNRVMFPIIDQRQNVIGFGARAMGDAQPKYLNTAETAVFNKRDNLYGLNLIKSKRLEDIVVVEGYMDVVSLAQCGVTNAVATLGTALTSQQARLIKRYAGRVYLCYDGDSAGQKATMRGIDILAEQQLEVKVITIPNGLDPDEYVKLHSLEGFDKLKAMAQSVDDYKLSAIYKGFDMNDAMAREECAKQACKYIAGLSPIVQQRYVIELAKLTGFPTDALKREIAVNPEIREVTRNTFTNFRNTRSNKATDVDQKRLLKEQVLLKLALEHEEFAQRLTGGEFACDQHKRIFAVLRENPQTDSGGVMTLLDGDLASFAAAALTLPDSEEAAAAFNQALLALKAFDLQDEKAALQAEGEREDTPTERKVQILVRIREVNAQLNEINIHNG